MLKEIDSGSKLRDLHLKSSRGWNPDLADTIPSVYLDEMERVTSAYTLDEAQISLFLADTETDVLNTLVSIITSLQNMVAVTHPICVWETSDPKRERCFQFETGQVLVFVHKDSLRAPYSGVFHEFVHALGLTGISEIDEGIATLFEDGAEAGALQWRNGLSFDQHWLSRMAVRPVSVDNPYVFGSSYFSLIVESQGVSSLWMERDRLMALGGQNQIVSEMQLGLSKAGEAAAADASSTVYANVSNLDALYFKGDLKPFMKIALEYFGSCVVANLPEGEQLTFGRFMIFLSTTDDSYIATSGFQALLFAEIDSGLKANPEILLEAAQRIYRSRQSSSRIALKKNSKALLLHLEANFQNDAIKADILLQLVQFHKYVPEIAGGSRESASEYAVQLAAVPGMETVGARLLGGLQHSEL